MNSQNKLICLRCAELRTRQEQQVEKGIKGERTVTLDIRYCNKDSDPIANHVEQTGCPLNLFIYPDDPAEATPKTAEQIAAETETAPVAPTPATAPTAPATVDPATIMAAKMDRTRTDARQGRIGRDVTPRKGCSACTRAAEARKARETTR